MSPPPRFLFIHVMKTGGTSFVFHLLQQFAPDEVYPSASLDRRDPTDAEPYASIPQLEAITPERRAGIRIYAGHFPYMVRDILRPDAKDGELETLTLLRNPVDRTVSVLKQFKRLYDRYRDLSLDAIYDDAFVYRHFVENHQTKLFSVTAADRPKMLASTIGYHEFREHLESSRPDVGDRPDTITIDADRLAAAKKNLAHVDVVGVNDRFDDFVETLRSRFGWWPAGMAGDARAMVSAEPWTASPELASRITRDNRFDVELYEYAEKLAR